jgi:hypothetical protein
MPVLSTDLDGNWVEAPNRVHRKSRDLDSGCQKHSSLPEGITSHSRKCGIFNLGAESAKQLINTVSLNFFLFYGVLGIEKLVGLGLSWERTRPDLDFSQN